MSDTHRRSRWQGGIPVAIQRSILFVAGLGLLVHEATLPAAEVSWPRLVVWTGMVGLPFAFRADELRRLLPPEDELRRLLPPEDELRRLLPPEDER